VEWLVTGGCGFIGTNLIRHLLREGGHRILVVDNLSVGRREDLARVCSFREVAPPSLGRGWKGEAVALVVGDIADRELARAAVQGREVVVHLAGNTGVQPSLADPWSDCINNVLGTLNYLEAARRGKVRRFIYASSGATVGRCSPPVHEKLCPAPVSPYGASKLAGEAYCSAYFHSFGLETVCLRFGNVYGPGSSHKSSVVARFFRRALEGRPLEIFGDGNQSRDFIYIDDLIEAILRAAKAKGVGGEVFQIATHRETTVRELAREVVAVLREAGVDRIEVRHAAPRPGEVRRNFSDITKARTRLGWEPRTSLRDGLALTLAWFQEHYSPRR
jgi:UDP-glucose 4-epimerase